MLKRKKYIFAIFIFFLLPIIVKANDIFEILDSDGNKTGFIIIVIIFVLIFLITHIIILTRGKNNKTVQDSDSEINQTTTTSELKCNNCGFCLTKDNKICPKCGANYVSKKELLGNNELRGKNHCVVDNIDYTSSENFYKKTNTVLWFIIGGFGVYLFWIIFASASGTVSDTLIPFFAGGLLCSIISASNNSTSLEEREKLLQKCQEKINKIINDGNESYVSLTLDVKGISINKDEKNVTIYNGLNAEPIKLNYKDILSFELIEDGSQEIEGKGAETYLAGRYLGTAAALAVASSSRNINQFCNQLIIEIHMIDIQTKNISIEIINDDKVDKTSADYKNLKTFSKNIVTTLDKIMREIDNEKTNNNSLNKKIENNIQDIPSKLREYKKLLDDEIITQKDFDDKKNELLKSDH